MCGPAWLGGTAGDAAEPVIGYLIAVKKIETEKRV
jgi:hypothetical protein